MTAVVAADHSARDLGLVRGHHALGISTGVFADGRGAWPELVRAALDVSRDVVELSALSYNELPGLLSYLDGRTLPFRYVSVHAPVKGDCGQDLPARLATLPLLVRSIVTHPDAIDSFPAYRRLAHRLVFENMDDRKADGRTANELDGPFAKLPAAGFCLDVAHAWSVDPSMSTAHELLDAFRSRLRHVHVSSLRDGRHVP